MLACVHVCKSAYVSVCVRVCDVRSYFLVCVCSCVRACVRMRVRACVCVCMPTCVSECLRARVRVFVSA